MNDASALTYAKADQIAGQSLYEATVTRPHTAPLAGSVTRDVTVVGGGFSGLWTALELAERGYSVTVLEARHIAWAASGRNGGQLLPGFSADIDKIAAALGKEEARRAWDGSIEGMRMVKERISRHAIDCELTQGWLLLAARKGHVKGLREWHEELGSDYGYGEHIEFAGPEKLSQWTASQGYYAAIVDHFAGHLHPLKLALGLAAAARAAGVSIHENSAVTGYTNVNGNIRVTTAQGEVHSKHLVLAANVFLGDLAPAANARIMPVGSTIIATEKLDPALAESLLHQRYAGCDTAYLLDYYRITRDGRMLWGGGSTYFNHAAASRAEALRQKMVSLYPQLAQAKIEYSWSGLIDVTRTRTPNFHRPAPNVYCLQGFCGHGINITALAGKLAATAIAGQSERFDAFARIQHQPFPGGPAIKSLALVLGTLYYRLRDQLS